ncbi:hypothetical protein [Yoonia sp. 208BN28-4]|uniref:hypothetical protein n=1 Tax=Yoonia sp. 208BN28-4 TaxID=3126505 RepID=UPI0030B54530
MKRRGFLQMLGAVIATPALPMAAPAQAATYNRYMYGLAVFHARTRPHVSVRGIAYCLKVTTAQAEAMIAEMTTAGHVTPVVGSGGSVRAVSNILRPDCWGLDAASRATRAKLRQARQSEISDAQSVQQQPFMAHLHQLCRDYGFTLSPRCVA